MSENNVTIEQVLESEKPLLSFYHSLLTSAGLLVKPTGTIHSTYNDIKPPVMIGDKALVLPLYDVLRNPDWGSQIAFHPALHSPLRGESTVQQTVRRWMTLRLNYVMMNVITAMWEIASDPERSGKLSVKRSKFLSILPDVKPKSVKALTQFMDRMDFDGSKKLITLNAKSKESVTGATIRSPIVADMDEKARKIYGQQFTIADYRQLLDTIEWVLPGLLEGKYTVSQANPEMGSFDAMLRVYGQAITQLNKSVRNLGTELGSDWRYCLSDVDWFKDIDELPKIMNDVPPLTETAKVVEEPAVQKSVADRFNTTVNPNGSVAVVDDRSPVVSTTTDRAPVDDRSPEPAEQPAERELSFLEKIDQNRRKALAEQQQQQQQVSTAPVTQVQQPPQPPVYQQPYQQPPQNPYAPPQPPAYQQPPQHNPYAAAPPPQHNPYAAAPPPQMQHNPYAAAPPPQHNPYAAAPPPQPQYNAYAPPQQQPNPYMQAQPQYYNQAPPGSATYTANGGYRR